ncbi:MAG: nitrilase-related carbon-nitrogen hydrolase [Fimbriimonadaceae bacterium]
MQRSYLAWDTRAMSFTVGVAQFTPKKADVSANLDKIAEFALSAAAEGAELVVFPETITSGYFLEGGVLAAAISPAELLDELDGRLHALDRPLDLLVGFYEKSGGNLYNSAAYLQVGQFSRVVHTYRKFFLPTYGVFDEERFVSRGHELGVFDTRLGRMAILICEDVWHSVLSALCAVAGAQIVLIPSASPARGFEAATIGNLDRYHRMLRAVSDEHGVYCVNAQLCGFEGGKGFVGGSSVINPFGHTIAEAPIMESHLVLCEIDPEIVEIARSQLPLTSDLQSAWGDICKIANKIER